MLLLPKEPNLGKSNFICYTVPAAEQVFSFSRGLQKVSLPPPPHPPPPSAWQQQRRPRHSRRPEWRSEVKKCVKARTGADQSPAGNNISPHFIISSSCSHPINTPSSLALPPHFVMCSEALPLFFFFFFFFLPRLVRTLWRPCWKCWVFYDVREEAGAELDSEVERPELKFTENKEEECDVNVGAPYFSLLCVSVCLSLSLSLILVCVHLFERSSAEH